MSELSQSATSSATSLPLFAPDRLPRRPWCVDQYGPGIAWRVRAVDQALRHLHIQPNTKTVIWRLIFDIDRPGAAFEHDLANLPPPNWAATNPANGHAHTAYEIQIPVLMLDRSTKAAKLLVAVEKAFGQRLGADPAFSGALCKNPMHNHWKVIEFCREAYSLTELAEWVAPELAKPTRRKNAVTPDSECYCIGRNFTMFEHLRKWAYRAVREYWRPNGQDAWLDAVRRQIDVIWGEDQTNWSTDSHAYTQAERDDTAKSVARWVWSRFTPTTFRKLVADTHQPEQQARRGKASGVARREAREQRREQARQMAVSGMSQRAIAAEIGVSLGTVNSWVR
jgi:DNA-directed RNA polymerase specialized sigma24 family protein